MSIRYAFPSIILIRLLRFEMDYWDFELGLHANIACILSMGFLVETDFLVGMIWFEERWEF